MEVMRLGARAVMLYFINRGDCTDFAPGDSADRLYGELFRQAMVKVSKFCLAGLT